MKIPELIKILKKARDYKNAELEFWAGEVQLEFKNVGQFGVGNDVVMHFEEIEVEDSANVSFSQQPVELDEGE